MIDILEAIKVIQQFERGSLTNQISSIESEMIGADNYICQSKYPSLGITPPLFLSANTLKRTASQINVLIHASGILLSLPYILEEGETIEYLSLGAGNTGKPFDLATNYRIAEFKFINWQGGPESIRQNSIFKDFYWLAEDNTERWRYLYVLGIEMPMKFLQGKRSLKSIMSRNSKLWNDFQVRYGEKYKTVSEYYEYRKGLVHLEDISGFLPQHEEDIFMNDDGVE